MADITISKFTTQVVRTGSTPSSSGFAVNEGQDPVDPSGSGQNHLPVTIGSPANGLSVTDAQILTIDKAQIFAGTSSQFVKGDGTLDSNTYLTTGSAAATYVPYTGATSDVDLGTHDLTAERGTFANNGSSNTLTVNHTSGSGYGIIVTKGGNNEALYVSKTSGSGNAMTVVGGRTSLVDLALSSVTNTAGDFLTISGGVVHKRTAAEVRTDIGAGTVTSVAALTLGTSGTDLSSTVANGTTTPVITLNVPTASASNRGALSSADWTTFNNKTSNLGTVTSVGLSSATSGVTIGSTPVTTSGTITLAIATASGSQNGLLSSTDWTTFNNKQNALTNPVTGTGTSGQVAYFTGTSAISSESNLFWDATNDRLGIGTATPAVKLNIVDTNPLVVGDSTGSLSVTYETGTTAIGQGGGIFLGIPASSGSFFSTYIKSAKEAADSANSAAALIFGTRVNGGSNTERMRITSGGNVQLTGDPFVYSNTTAGGTAIHAGLRFNSTNKSIRFFTNDVTAADIFSDGNVLIGSSGSNAGFKLDVNGTGRFSGQITMAYSGNPRLVLQDIDSGAGNVGILFKENTTDEWTIASASGNLLFFNEGGLGTALSLNGSTNAATFSSSVTATSPGNSANSIVGNYSGGSQMMQFFQKPDGSNMEFNLRNSSGTAIARIDTNGNSFFNGGNVGIGTDSPVYKFVVSNSGATGLEIDPGTLIVNRNLLINFNRSTGVYSQIQIDASLTILGQQGNVLIGTATNGASKLRISGLPTSAVGLSSGDVYNLAGVLMIA
jgi:hypothetical protein